MAARFHDSPIPRYLQLAELMRQRIARGRWIVGQKLPSLEALVEEFGVARVTVRQAIELLAREGLVSPQQGRGTFVTGDAAPPRRLRVQTSLADLAQVYRDTRPTIVNLEESTASAPLRPEDGAPATRYTYMRRIHSHEGRPYCVIDIHLDEAIFRKRPARFRSETVIPILASMPEGTVARARQVLTISTADLDVARRLEVPVNAPVAQVRRVFNDAKGCVIYLAEVTYRGDFVRLDMDLMP